MKFVLIMVENQSILIITGVFVSIYIGILLRYFLISRGIYNISKFIIVKLLTRVLLFSILIFSIYFLPKKTVNSTDSNSIYFSLSNKSLDIPQIEINHQMIDFLNLHSNIKFIGCINLNVFGTYALVPMMTRENYINYIKRFDFKKLPKIKLDHSPKNLELLLYSNTENSKEDFNFLKSFTSFFNLYNISKLRNYLLILMVIILGLDILIVKNIIKN